MFQTFISRHNSNFFSDKLVLTSVTPASSAPVLQIPKATSSTLYFDSLTVNAGNGGFLHCIQMDASVNAANQVVSVFFFFQAEDGIRYLTVTGVQTCALPIYFRSQQGRIGFPGSRHPFFVSRRLEKLCPTFWVRLPSEGKRQSSDTRRIRDLLR